jgi:hypothetical protein
MSQAFLRQSPQRLAVEPGDALDHLAVVVAKAFLGDGTRDAAPSSY